MPIRWSKLEVTLVYCHHFASQSLMKLFTPAPSLSLFVMEITSFVWWGTFPPVCNSPGFIDMGTVMYLLRPLSEPHDFSILGIFRGTIPSFGVHGQSAQAVWCERSWLLTPGRRNCLDMSAICRCYTDGCWAPSLQPCTQAALQLVVKNPVDPVVARAMCVTAGGCHQ